MLDEDLHFTRTRGLPVLVVIVAAGMGIPAIFKYKAQALDAERESILANAPSEPEARLSLWLAHGAPRILEGLRAARFSARQPWIVSHVVAPQSAGEAPWIYGIDQTLVQPSWIVQEGTTVYVRLPAPRLVGRDVLVGDNSLGVAVFKPDDSVDAAALLRGRVEHVLERLSKALPEDIEGTRLVVEVASQ